ncbi:hypothetical protein [Shewanella sp.]|uniref:hypothetical protein n=1 Tax=Shewanella sp. TaxID=50422 RepID=UPI003A96B3D9
MQKASPWHQIKMHQSMQMGKTAVASAGLTEEVLVAHEFHRDSLSEKTDEYDKCA